MLSRLPAILPLTKPAMTALSKHIRGRLTRRLGLGATETPAVTVRVEPVLVTGRVGMGKVAGMGSKGAMTRAPEGPITAIDSPPFIFTTQTPHIRGQ